MEASRTGATLAFLFELALLLCHKKLVLDLVFDVRVVGRVQTQRVRPVILSDHKTVVGHLTLFRLFRNTRHGLVVSLVGTSTINKHAFRAIYQFLQALKFLGKTLNVNILGLSLLGR